MEGWSNVTLFVSELDSGLESWDGPLLPTGQTQLTSAASLTLLGDILQGEPKYHLTQGGLYVIYILAGFH